MGGKQYVRKTLEETAHKVAQFCEGMVKLEHLQMGFILLRLCCGMCRVVHILRAKGGNGVDELIDSVDKSVMDSAVAMLRTPCSPVERTH